MNDAKCTQGTDPPEPIVLLEYLLFFLLSLRIGLCLLWVVQHPITGNLGSALLVLHLLIMPVYLVSVPVLGFVHSYHFFVGKAAENRAGEAPLYLFERYCLQAFAWVILLAFAWVGVGNAISGGVPIYARVQEGPDTKYARAGFEELLKRPVPDHVHGINFQNRNNILDEHQILRFNTADKAFIQSLIQDYELELESTGKVGDERYKPGAPPYYTEKYRLGSFILFYNRETGDAKFEWFES